MNRRAGSIFIGVLVLVVLIAALMKNRSNGSAIPVPREIFIETPAAQKELPSQAPPQAVTDSDNVRLEEASMLEGDTLKDKIKNTKLIDVVEYRDEVKKNPHATPKKYIASSLKLGTLFDSVKSETDATDVMLYYKECLSSEAPPPLKVSCFNYSKRIADSYPGLKKDFEPLYNNLEPEVRQIVDLKNAH